jgi:carbon monoxide dehydrogenase subunit G
VEISTSEAIVIARPPEDVFDFIVDVEAPAKTFRGHGPIPAVERTEVVGGGPLCEGAICRVHNADGSVVEREITVVDRPRRHEYRLNGGFRSVFALLVRSGRAAWELEPAEGGTRVVWRYRFELTSPLSYPFAKLILAAFFRGAMRSCLEATRKELSPA